MVGPLRGPVFTGFNLSPGREIPFGGGDGDFEFSCFSGASDLELTKGGGSTFPSYEKKRDRGWERRVDKPQPGARGNPYRERVSCKATFLGTDKQFGCRLLLWPRGGGSNHHSEGSTRRTCKNGNPYQETERKKGKKRCGHAQYGWKYWKHQM